ncbi:MAG: molybdopterin-dependent oxidoreductase [Treponema sp.]|jgi:CO/xanthine dehydrogenase Mo-binding subunit|nr:molybdopterin-dependent oxidoreductase [Treponema sp.]
MDGSCFIEDIYPRQTLYAITIRSPIACGRLKSIECPKLPNIYTLITAADIPGKNRLEDTDLPILASDALSYIGEPVGLLLGPDKNTLEEYVQQCKVIAEEETPSFSTHYAGDMVIARRNIRIGEPEAAFERTTSVVRGDYHTGIQEHWYAEPVGAVALFEQSAEDEQSAAADSAEKKSAATLVVHTATQWPFHVKRSIVQTLKYDPARVQVEQTQIGLQMDGKLWYPSLIACHAALGAHLTKKPVRLMLTRKEDFCFSPKRFDSEISITSVLNEKGEITGTEIDVCVNLGAYGVGAAEMLDQSCMGSLGGYYINNLKLSGVALKTNIPPQGPFSGYGLAQGFFAMERHISHIADTLKQNPVEWRKNNVPGTGTLPLGMGSRSSANGNQLLDAAVLMSDYNRKWAAYELLRQKRRQRFLEDSAPDSWAEKGETLRGVGIALGWQESGLLYPGADRGNYGIEMTLEKDGSLQIKTSALGSTEDRRSLWAGIAAEILSIDAASVRISSIDSPDSGPCCASRTVTVLTKLVEHACLAIRKQRFRDPLPITVRKNIRPQKNSALEAVFPPPEGMTLDAGSFSRPGWAASVVEIEISPIEYIPKIRGVWLCVDGGRILSQDGARRKLGAAAVQALGWAYREQISYANGIISQEQFEACDISGPVEIPPIYIDFLATGAEEPKGIGGLPFNCIPAAYMQAVSQAMDHHFQSIPLAAQDIWEAEKFRKAGNVL